jgi:hypothetical protein
LRDIAASAAWRRIRPTTLGSVYDPSKNRHALSRGARTAIPIDKYLHTRFPDLDRQYRALPDYLHGKAQSALILFFALLRRRPAPGIELLPANVFDRHHFDPHHFNRHHFD